MCVCVAGGARLDRWRIGRRLWRGIGERGREGAESMSSLSSALSSSMSPLSRSLSSSSTASRCGIFCSSSSNNMRLHNVVLPLL